MNGSVIATGRRAGASERAQGGWNHSAGSCGPPIEKANTTGRRVCGVLRLALKPETRVRRSLLDLLAIPGIQARGDQRARSRGAVEGAGATECRAPPLLTASPALVCIRRATYARAGSRACRQYRAQRYRCDQSASCLHVRSLSWSSRLD